MNAPPENPKSYGDMIFSLTDRQERCAERLNTKIELIEQRLTILEERERS